MINFFKERIQLASKNEVLQLHILIKCKQQGYSLSDADVNCLIELYNNGYGKSFYAICVEKGYFESEQTVRNSIAKMTNLGILWYKKRGERFVNKEILPDIQNDHVIFQYLIGNLS